MNKQEAVAIKEASRQKAVALKKASKVYRQRLRHFTGDIERLASQVRDQVSVHALTDRGCYLCLESVREQGYS